MNDFRSIRMPADGDRSGDRSDIDRKALWVIRELGLVNVGPQDMPNRLFSGHA